MRREIPYRHESCGNDLWQGEETLERSLLRGQRSSSRSRQAVELSKGLRGFQQVLQGLPGIALDDPIQSEP